MFHQPIMRFFQFSADRKLIESYLDADMKLSDNCLKAAINCFARIADYCRF